MAFASNTSCQVISNKEDMKILICPYTIFNRKKLISPNKLFVTNNLTGPIITPAASVSVSQGDIDVLDIIKIIQNYISLATTVAKSIFVIQINLQYKAV